MKKFSDKQLDTLRTQYGAIQKMDPFGDGYKKLTSFLDNLEPELLKQLSDTDIKWVSVLARNRVLKQKMKTEGVHQSTISAIASHSYTPAVGDKIRTRKGPEMSGTVKKVSGDTVYFTSGEKTYKTDVRNVMRESVELSEDSSVVVGNRTKQIASQIQKVKREMASLKLGDPKLISLKSQLVRLSKQKKAIEAKAKNESIETISEDAFGSLYKTIKGKFCTIKIFEKDTPYDYLHKKEWNFTADGKIFLRALDMKTVKQAVATLENGYTSKATDKSDEMEYLVALKDSRYLSEGYSKPSVKWNVEYANSIYDEGKDVKRMSHHVFDVDKESLIAIKKEFEKDAKKKAFFDKATKGMSQDDLTESVKEVSKKKHQQNLKDGKYEEMADATKSGYVEVRHLGTGKRETIRLVESENIISEGIESEIEDMADMTDNNDHTGALIALATLLKDKVSLKKLQDIKAEQDRAGHLPSTESEARSKIYKVLMASAKAKFDAETYKKIHSAF